jgi:AcrR family transcriptional regulator
MPKLPARDVEKNRRRIEAAALRLFTRQGYHGTSIREIANATGSSIGNIYNYYRSKEELFRAVVQSYEAKMEVLRGAALGPMRNVFSPRELQRLARAIRQIVCDNPDYWRLMYLDVIEFGSRHFAHTFRELSANMRKRLGSRLVESTRRGRWRGINPALAFTAIYLQLFTYFLVETLFGGKRHLGMSDDRAISQLIEMVSHGLWRDGKPVRGNRGRRIRQ